MQPALRVSLMLVNGQDVHQACSTSARGFVWLQTVMYDSDPALFKQHATHGP